MVSYDRLWELIYQRHITKNQLGRMCDISSATICRMGKCEYVQLNVLERICIALDCNLEDIVEIKRDNQNE